MAQDLQLCILCHGMAGSSADFSKWEEWLHQRCPEWIVKNCQSVTEGSTPVIGLGLDRLAEYLAAEVRQTIAELQAAHGDIRLTMHFLGHSMGGIVLRGALPSILDHYPTVELGVFMSLSCPHLGVQASWGAPTALWRNLSFLLKLAGPQIPQLAVQDRSAPNECPYLVHITDPKGPHMQALGRFRRRICLTMSCNDVVIPPASGSLWKDRPQSELTVPTGQAAGWGFECVSIHRPSENDHASAREWRAPQDGDWEESSDRQAWFPRQMLAALLTLEWERIIVNLQLSSATTHVFLIAKKRDQNAIEHHFSLECLDRVGQKFVAATSGDDTKIVPQWVNSLDDVFLSAQACPKDECCGRWFVARVECTGTVRCYAFDEEPKAKQYFTGSPAVSRILFDPEGIEYCCAGANVASFPTIHNFMAWQTPVPHFDGHWIVGAEHGYGHIIWYHLRTESLAWQFIAKAFHVQARILFDPHGEELQRTGINWWAQTSIANAMKEHRSVRGVAVVDRCDTPTTAASSASNIMLERSLTIAANAMNSSPESTLLLA